MCTNKNNPLPVNEIKYNSPGEIYEEYVIETNETFRENDCDEQYWAIYSSSDTLSYCDRIRRKFQHCKWWIIDICLLIFVILIIFIIIYVLKIKKSTKQNDDLDLMTTMPLLINSTTTFSPIATEKDGLNKVIVINATDTGWTKYFQ